MGRSFSRDPAPWLATTQTANSIAPLEVAALLQFRLQVQARLHCNLMARSCSLRGEASWRTHRLREWALLKLEASSHATTQLAARIPASAYRDKPAAWW